MRRFNKQELKAIADRHGIGFNFDDALLVTVFSGNLIGFEPTEVDGDQFGGFRYFGKGYCQSQLLPVWNELSGESEPMSQEVLTPQMAKDMLNKKIKIYYHQSSGSRVYFTIKVVEVYSKPSKQIGQKSEYVLKFNLLDDDGRPDYVDDGTVRDFIYEWQGIFPVTGSAHVVHFDGVV